MKKQIILLLFLCALGFSVSAKVRYSSSFYFGVEGENVFSLKGLEENSRILSSGNTAGLLLGLDFTSDVAMQFHYLPEKDFSFTYTDKDSPLLKIKEGILKRGSLGLMFLFFPRGDRSVGEFSDIQPYLGLGMSQESFSVLAPLTKADAPVDGDINSFEAIHKKFPSMNIRLGLQIPVFSFLRLDIGVENSIILSKNFLNKNHTSRSDAAYVALDFVYRFNSQESEEKASGACPILKLPKYYSCPEQ